MKTTMHRLLVLCALAFSIIGGVEAQNKQPKYIFYLISDGTGVNTILGSEMYHAELNGFIGRVPYLLNQLPVIGLASTYSDSNGVTDSAASGTALACGKKTFNGSIGMDVDKKTPIHSIAYWAKEKGARVGIATSVPTNHATPGAFYGHRNTRHDYYGIGTDLLQQEVDFIGGAEINSPKNKKDASAKDLYTLYQENGYCIARGYDEYLSNRNKASKMCLIQKNYHPASGAFSIPYAIDARPEDLTIEQIMQAELDFLMQDSTQGFFLMNEIGGKVDFACHVGDGATAFRELDAVDRCIKIAYDFYQRHPDETLIVFTADHETGGLVLAENNKYELNLKILQNQKVSLDGATALVHQLRKDTQNRVSWEQIKQLLTQNFGFWNTVELTQQEEETLRDIYNKSFLAKMDEVENLYSKNEPIVDTAKRILNAKAKIMWSTGGHSAGLVPVCACGVGAEAFMGYNDNANIPLKIAKIAGYPIK